MNISIVSINMKLFHKVWWCLSSLHVYVYFWHIGHVYFCSGMCKNAWGITVPQALPLNTSLDWPLNMHCIENTVTWMGPTGKTSSSLEYVTITLNSQRMYQSQKLETALYILNMQCLAELDMKIMYSISRFSLMICWARHNALIALP